MLRPGERLSHVSAADWLGVPIPRRFEEDRTVHVTGALHTVQVRRKDFFGHRGRGGDDLMLVRGVPVSTPPRMFLELAGVLRFDELVAAGDHLVLVPRVPQGLRPFTTIEDLAEACRSGSHQKGAPRAREALMSVRAGVESPRETMLRLLLLRAGFPEPVCGYELRTREHGFIGWFDLAWPGTGVLGEYDGDGHRTSTEQYERDIRRFDLAAEAGRRVVRVRAAGLTRAGEPDTIARFRRAFALDAASRS